MRLYVDGVLVASNSVTTSSRTPVTGESAATHLGRRQLLRRFGRQRVDLQLGAVRRASRRPLRAGLNILPPNVLPSVEFTHTVDELDVDFDATASDSDGTIVSYVWDFGDGGSSTEQDPSHTYLATGSYSVSVTVTDDRGGVDTATHSVSVLAPNQLPTADFSATADELEVGFDGTLSSDLDGTIVGYSWDFGDSSPADLTATPSHTYAAGGDYSVTLTVTDDRGGIDTETKQVSVNADPTAVFTSSTDTGLLVSFDAVGSSDPDGTITSYVWDFAGVAGSGVNPTHTFPADGTYTVTLTVTDDDGATDVFAADVTVANVAPVASFTQSSANLTASFQSTATDVDGSIITHSWDFGDGSPISDGASQSHTYVAGGTYLVTLTVTDNKGATDTETKDVTVSPANLSPAPSFTFATNGLDVSVDATASVDTDGSIVGYAWTFGDGGTANTAVANHTYAGSGTFTVTLTVTDDDGATAQTSQDVTVVAPNQAPTAAFTSSNHRSDGRLRRLRLDRQRRHDRVVRVELR